jgi:hypothetical protein
MGKWPRTFIVFLSLLSTTAPTLAADFSLGSWHTSGLQTWRTTFPLHTATVDGASELSYPHTGNYLVATYENKLSQKQTLEIEAATTTTVGKKTGSDSDWDYSISNNLWYYGNFDTQDKSTFFNINWKQHHDDHTDFFWGYTYNTNHSSMTNGLYSIYNYNPVHTTLTDFNSQYIMTYQGPHVGVTHTIPLTKTIRAIGSVTYSPLLLAQGSGWWNLRDLSFEHTGSGQMLDTTIGLQFSTTPKNSSITLGYRYQYFSLYTGTENLSPDITWKKAINTQRGYYITGNLLF